MNYAFYTSSIKWVFGIDFANLIGITVSSVAAFARCDPLFALLCCFTNVSRLSLAPAVIGLYAGCNFPADSNHTEVVRVWATILGCALIALLTLPTNIAVAECCINPLNVLAEAIHTCDFITIVCQTPGLFAKDASPVLSALAAVWYIHYFVSTTIIISINYDLASIRPIVLIGININRVFNLTATQVRTSIASVSTPSQIALALMFLSCCVHTNSIVVAVISAFGCVAKGPLPVFIAVAG